MLPRNGGKQEESISIDWWTLEDWTDRLCRKGGNQLHTHPAAQRHRKTMVLLNCNAMKAWNIAKLIGD